MVIEEVTNTDRSSLNVFKLVRQNISKGINKAVKTAIVNPKLETITVLILFPALLR